MKKYVKSMYWHILTPYSFNKVMSKCKSIKNVQIISTDKETQSATKQSSEGVLLTNPIKCTCSFEPSMYLPCHHKLNVRQMYNISLFDPYLCSER